MRELCALRRPYHYCLPSPHAKLFSALNCSNRGVAMPGSSATNGVDPTPIHRPGRDWVLKYHHIRKVFRRWYRFLMLGGIRWRLRCRS